MSRWNPPWGRWWFRRLSRGEELIILAAILAIAAIFDPQGARDLVRASEDGLEAMAADLGRAPVSRILPERMVADVPSHDGLRTGGARVLDGDTFDLAGERIRLQGVDAFERDQTCAGRPCGEASRRALQRLVSGRQVSCRPVDTDRYGRTVATCTAGGRDLGAEMVRSGHALAYERYSRAYVDEEREARREGSGAWAYGGFIDPADYRHGG